MERTSRGCRTGAAPVPSGVLPGYVEEGSGGLRFKRCGPQDHFTLASHSRESLVSLQIQREVIVMIRIGAVFMVFGLACFMAFNMIGSTVDDVGILHEPFALLPIGYGLLFIGVLVALFGWVNICIRRYRAKVGR